jgi:hypothetical protein
MGGVFVASRPCPRPRAFAWLRRAASRLRISCMSCGIKNGLPGTHLSHLSSRFAAALLTAALGACSGSPLIDFHAADYRETEASAGDSQLLLNILRAKDDLPIHFADLSNIHGSIQMTASGTATIPFAHFAGSTTPSTAGPTLGAQIAPTFDVGTLDTQDFTRGMLSPVNPQIVKQLFDQGVDPRLIMILFVSEYRDPYGHVFQNNMSCDLSYKLDSKGECKNRIYNFLTQIDGIFKAHHLPATFTQAAERYPSPVDKQQHLAANVYVALTPVGGDLSGSWTLKDNFGDLRQLDTTKLKLLDAKTARLAGQTGEITPGYKRIYSISEPRLAICYEIKGRLYALAPPRPASSPWIGNDACRHSEVIVQDTPFQAQGFSLRSAYEIIQFLGQVLRFQEEKGANRCLTLSVETGKEETRTCDGGEVLFQVNGERGAPIVGTRYDGTWYTINDRKCNKEHNGVCDYSLQVLAILELLLNSNKVAKDIIATPRVQVVP